MRHPSAYALLGVGVVGAGVAAYWLTRPRSGPPVPAVLTVQGPSQAYVGAVVTWTARLAPKPRRPVDWRWTLTGPRTTAPRAATTSTGTDRYTVTVYQEGTYTLTVTATCACGKVYRATATLTVHPTPPVNAGSVIVQGPTSGQVGQALTFTAVTNGVTAPQYQWWYTIVQGGSREYPWSTANTLTLTPDTPGQYVVGVYVVSAANPQALLTGYLTVMVAGGSSS